MFEHVHVHPKFFYVKVFLALIFLTALTTAVAYVDLGYFNTVAALVIAVVKASLVVLFFMHLKEQEGMTRVVIVAAVLWLAVFIVITLSDRFTRHWVPSNGPWEGSAITAPQSE
ncbi:MAG TPA: cytochrome C oxidase subunit IV family protein [Terriglobia bacterium]|nr:cytochrome C oxidase subunit IV family protein [Terriglobia bacterium]